MNVYQKKYIALYLFTAFFIITGCNQPEPQEPNPVQRKSPIAIAKVTHQPTDTYIKIVYGQPYKREREIFGDLVPYGEVWRTGANEATELTTTRDIIFGGQELQAGTYSLFTIPREDENWTIILNEELGQWGAFDYDESADVMRVDASATNKKNVTEAFTIQFSEVQGDSVEIIMEWDQTMVEIPVRFTENSELSS